MNNLLAKYGQRKKKDSHIFIKKVNKWEREKEREREMKKRKWQKKTR